ncbi:MAG: hypothetical protein ACJ748_14560, partial [Flavisolibacter sp.]
MSTSVKPQAIHAEIKNDILTASKEGPWTEIIEPKTHLFDLKLREVWKYRDLVMMFVRRDFVSNYK